MNDWKEELRKVKDALSGTVSKKAATGKPQVTDFVPPGSWLKPDDGHSKQKQPSLNKALVPNKHRNAQCVGQPVPVSEPTKSVTTSASTGERVRSAGMNSASDPVQAFRPKIDAGRWLSMPSWINTGRPLQPSGNQGGRELAVVRVGIDFGTAFTKVAIKAGVDTVLVDWSAVTGDESPTGRYVMPGFVCRTRRGEYTWQRSKESDIYGNLKLPVIDMAASEECPSATLAFLALVIRYTRAFLYRHPDVGRKLASRSHRWSLNIGCPTAPYEKPEVVEFFRRIARTAWRLAGNDDLGEADITAAWRDQENEDGLEAAPGVIPEFVAQIAGYLNSPQVGEGLHALVDIGAATLDVAAFNVVKNVNRPDDPNWRIPIFFPKVLPLGTHFLNQNRYQTLKLPLHWDDTKPPITIKAFASEHAIPMNEVERVDKDFQKEVVKCILHVLDSTRTNNRGVGTEDSAWRQGLPYFLTGGGSEVELYAQAVEEVESQLAKKILASLGAVEGGHFRLFEVTLGTADRRRLSVALGLTEGSEDDIAKIISFRNVEPLKRPQRDLVRHEELYGGR